MKDGEDLVEKFLRAHFKEVIYEPIPNSPPDFLVDGNVAVEVRRLDQNEIFGGKYRSLEQTRKPFIATVKSTLFSLGPPIGGKSWFVHLRFRRPIPAKKQVNANLSAFLQFLPDSGIESGRVIRLTPSLQSRLHRPVRYMMKDSSWEGLLMGMRGAGCFQSWRRTWRSASSIRKQRLAKFAEGILPGG